MRMSSIHKNIHNRLLEMQKTSPEMRMTAVQENLCRKFKLDKTLLWDILEELSAKKLIKWKGSKIVVKTK